MKLLVLLPIFFLNWPGSGYAQPVAGKGLSPRRMVTVNERWRFQKGSHPGAKAIDFNDCHWDFVQLPHTWNAEDADDETPGYYRGESWYRRQLNLGPSFRNKQIFLYFEGANQETEVYINGRFAGEHKGGYTRFCFDITPFLNLESRERTTCQLAVKVNNRKEETIPPLNADFTFFGGIYRDVYLITTEKIHFDLLNLGSSGVFVETPEVSARQALARVRGKVVNEQETARKLRIHTFIFDKEGNRVAQADTSILSNRGEPANFSLDYPPVADPHLWSPESPYLYQVVTQVRDGLSGELLDEVRLPLGFRWFRFDTDNGFFLNDRAYKLIGVNRHQDYLGMGNAVPDHLQAEDIRLIKAMGANFLRIAHYPQDPVVLEMCDRLGILASVEIPIVNAITESEAFYQNCRHMHREMIRQNYNHPSVIIWAYMNEVLLRLPFEEQSERYQMYARHVAQLAGELETIAREEDSYRYTMIPNHGSFARYHAAGLTRIPMLVGWNLYQGWYNDGFDGFGDFLDMHHRELPDKPLLVTEYGAGADPRLRSFQPRRFDFSLEWENLYHTHYLQAIRRRPFVSGAMVWNFADFYSETRIDPVPHVNSKGLMTLDRRPKDAYYLYQAQLSTRPVLALGERLWPQRAGTADLPGGATCRQPVNIYSNLDEVELWLNGRSLGKQKVEQATATWQVPFPDGISQLEARAVKGDTLYRDVMTVAFTLFPHSLQEASGLLPDLAINVGADFYFFDEKQRLVWLPDRKYVDGNWGYTDGEPFTLKTRNGTRVGSPREIRGTEVDPLFQTQQTGLSAYRFDVPAGIYELSLYLAELLSGEELKALPYELADNESEEIRPERGKRVFDVRINGVPVLENVDLAREYGPEQAIIKKFVVQTTAVEGIHIEFSAQVGKPVLNAVLLHHIR